MAGGVAAGDDRTPHSAGIKDLAQEEAERFSDLLVGGGHIYLRARNGGTKALDRWIIWPFGGVDQRVLARLYCLQRGLQLRRKPFARGKAVSGVKAVPERDDQPIILCDLGAMSHFGLGFYSSFMVASQVELVTRSAREGSQAVRWRGTAGR